MIAIRKLRQVREGLALRNRKLRIRYLFIEKDPQAFARLQRATAELPEHEEILTLNGKFEDLTPDIVSFVGTAFSLVFIDPTGWTGFGLKRIAPLLLHRPGEVLINFMFNHINRFLNDRRPETMETFEELMGGPCPPTLSQSPRREDAIVELYSERVRARWNFQHVTSTRIQKPLSDRAYFYLIYGTRHPKGLVEFRVVEKKAVYEQEQVRKEAQQTSRIGRSGQAEMFLDTVLQGPPSFETERQERWQKARATLRELLQKRQQVPYEAAQATVLEIPLVWESDLRTLVMEMKDAGEITIPAMRVRERTPKPGHVLVFVNR